MGKSRTNKLTILCICKFRQLISVIKSVGRWNLHSSSMNILLIIKLSIVRNKIRIKWLGVFEEGVDMLLFKYFKTSFRLFWFYLYFYSILLLLNIIIIQQLLYTYNYFPFFSRLLYFLTFVTISVIIIWNFRFTFYFLL